MGIYFFLEDERPGPLHRTQHDRDVSSDFWNGARAGYNKRDVCGVGFEQNQILRRHLRERSGNIVNGPICRLRHGIDAAFHDAAISDEFSVIRYKETVTVRAEMSASVENGHNHNGVAHCLRDFGEICRWIWRRG